MLMLMAGRKKLGNVRRCFQPPPEAIAGAARLLAPGDARC
jgi:hypothetical protein